MQDYNHHGVDTGRTSSRQEIPVNAKAEDYPEWQGGKVETLRVLPGEYGPGVAVARDVGGVPTIFPDRPKTGGKTLLKFRTEALQNPTRQASEMPPVLVALFDKCVALPEESAANWANMIEPQRLVTNGPAGEVLTYENGWAHDPDAARKRVAGLLLGVALALHPIPDPEKVYVGAGTLAALSMAVEIRASVERALAHRGTDRKTRRAAKRADKRAKKAQRKARARSKRR